MSATPHAAQRVRPPREPRPPALPESLTAAGAADLELRDDGTYLSLAYGEDRLTVGDAEDVEDVEFERCRFARSSLAGVRLQRAGFADVVFEGCDLANLRMFNSRMFNAEVRNCRMTGLQVTEGGLRDVRFDGCRADMAGFRFARLRTVAFVDCNLSEASFQSAELHDVRFEGCRLSGTQFSGATMSGTRFRDCELSGVAGIRSFDGAIVAAQDAMSLLDALAADAGITIEA
ncbi:MAG TPA: pentapeptide repeat-containing protein [Spirillospora sp.]|nr:pentapeptide repeat-containing protein [Spirillospora sp.]